jgi:hypothetical protein
MPCENGHVERVSGVSNEFLQICFADTANGIDIGFVAQGQEQG